MQQTLTAIIEILFLVWGVWFVVTFTAALIALYVQHRRR